MFGSDSVFGSEDGYRSASLVRCLVLRTGIPVEGLLWFVTVRFGSEVIVVVGRPRALKASQFKSGPLGKPNGE